ncbi:MAG: uracil-DNA glycosylase [Thermoleophilia bacterium]|nr:uracil-DNA glycosylase [Thermoleophilia bacterium]
MSLLARNTDKLPSLDREMEAEASREGRLEIIATHVRRCLRCDLSDRRLHAVPGEGSATARLMMVGESPGASEDAVGRPFVGRSGGVLDRVLNLSSLRREDVFITSIVKCRSADRAGAKLRNRAPLKWEIGACRPYLTRQVEIIRPRIILCLGGSAARGVIDPGFRLTEQRGKFFPGPFSSELMATFHPAYAGRWKGSVAQGRNLEELLLQDIKMARDRLV